MNIKKMFTAVIIIIICTVGLIFYEPYSHEGLKNRSNSLNNESNHYKSTTNSDYSNNYKESMLEKNFITDTQTSKPIPETSNEEPTKPVTANEEPIKPFLENADIVSNPIKKSIDIFTYISNLSTYTYTITSGDTISKLLKPFESTCNYNTAFKHLRLINNSLDLNILEIGDSIKIPDTAFTNGRLYRIVYGDTWYKIVQENYPNYNVDDTIRFLIDINDLPNKDCPLGENIFLPIL